jgi:hypothetical protein
MARTRVPHVKIVMLLGIVLVQINVSVSGKLEWIVKMVSENEGEYMTQK